MNLYLIVMCDVILYIASALPHVFRHYSSQTKGGAVTPLGAQSFFGEMSLLNPMGETVLRSVSRRAHLPHPIHPSKDFIFNTAILVVFTFQFEFVL